MFNAVSKLGYEIVERHAHGYYIDRYPIGLDAAVFEPGSTSSGGTTPTRRSSCGRGTTRRA